MEEEVISLANLGEKAPDVISQRTESLIINNSLEFNGPSTQPLLL